MKNEDGQKRCGCALNFQHMTHKTHHTHKQTRGSLGTWKLQKTQGKAGYVQEAIRAAPERRCARGGRHSTDKAPGHRGGAERGGVCLWREGGGKGWGSAAGGGLGGLHLQLQDLVAVRLGLGLLAQHVINLGGTSHMSHMSYVTHVTQDTHVTHAAHDTHEHICHTCHGCPTPGWGIRQCSPIGLQFGPLVEKWGLVSLRHSIFLHLPVY